MKEDSLVSVIVPIYQIRQEDLEHCIRSILAQTHRNLEIFLVDDGSPDSCGRICDEYAGRDGRITVIHQPNQGVSAARNAGLSGSSGEFIAFVDPDDYIQDNYIEELLGRIPQEADIISCCCKIAGEDFTDEDHFYPGDRIFTDEDYFCPGDRVFTDDNHIYPGDHIFMDENYRCPDDRIIADDRREYHGGRAGAEVCRKKDLYLQLMDRQYGQEGRAYIAFGVPWGKLYRARFLKDHDLQFDPGLPRMQDNIFNMYAFKYARAVYYLDTPLYTYRYEHLSGFMMKTGEAYRRIFIAVVKARYDCLQETGLMCDPEIKSAYLQECGTFLNNILYRGIFHSENAIAFREKCKLADGLISAPPFEEIVSEYCPAGSKDRIYFRMIRNRLWVPYAAISGLRSVRERRRSVK